MNRTPENNDAAQHEDLKERQAMAFNHYVGSLMKMNNKRALRCIPHLGDLNSLPGLEKEKDHYSPLMTACSGEHSSYEMAKYLLDSGADPNMQNDLKWTALEIACVTRHSEIIRLLVRRGAKVTNIALEDILRVPPYNSSTRDVNSDFIADVLFLLNNMDDNDLDPNLEILKGEPIL